MFKNNLYFKILAVCLVLSGAACIKDENPTESILDNPFQDQSTETPVADLVADFDLQATVTGADDNDYCDSISASLSAVPTLKISVADTGECVNRETVDAIADAVVTELCAAHADNIVYQLKQEYDVDGCVITSNEVYNVTLQDDGTLSGEYVGFATSSGCVNDDGTDAVSGECNFGGTVAGTVSEEEEAVDADGDTFTTDVDCDDADATINPDATEIVDNGIDEDCSGADLTTAEVDADSDGSFADVDCDDADAAINPSATEILDNDVDEDCDGFASLSTDDNDVDGFTADVDCDDADATVFPTATEVADNGIDEDCDGSDLVTTVEEVDADLDGFNAGTDSGDDCDDTDATINPDAIEILDNDVDENCDGVKETTTTEECEDGDETCDPDFDNDGLCDHAIADDDVVIDYDDSTANTWYWVDYESTVTTGTGGFAYYEYVDGTKNETTGEIFVYGVVEDKAVSTRSFCAGTHEPTMVGICIKH